MKLGHADQAVSGRACGFHLGQQLHFVPFKHHMVMKAPCFQHQEGVDGVGLWCFQSLHLAGFCYNPSGPSFKDDHGPQTKPSQTCANFTMSFAPRQCCCQVLQAEIESPGSGVAAASYASEKPGVLLLSMKAWLGLVG